MDIKNPARYNQLLKEGFELQGKDLEKVEVVDNVEITHTYDIERDFLYTYKKKKLIMTREGIK